MCNGGNRVSLGKVSTLLSSQPPVAVVDFTGFSVLSVPFPSLGKRLKSK